jgi:hypothetical protein
MRHGNTLVDQPDEPRRKIDLCGPQWVTCDVCGNEYETERYELYDADDDRAYIFASCPECKHIRGSVESYQRPDTREHEGAKEEQ